MYKKSLVIYKSVLGENHLDTARSYDNLAEFYKGKGEYENAGKLYEKGLNIYINILGENHPDTARSYSNLAEVYKEQGYCRRAMELYEKSLAILESVFIDEYPDIGIICFKLIELYGKVGEYEKGEDFCKRVLQKFKGVLGKSKEWLDVSGMFYKMWELEVGLKKEIQSMEMVLGENHLDVASYCNKAAYMYEKNGYLGSALEFYLRAYVIFVYRFGFNHPETQVIYKNMEVVYSKWNPEIDFEQWLGETMKKTRRLFRVVRNKMDSQKGDSNNGHNVYK